MLKEFVPRRFSRAVIIGRRASLTTGGRLRRAPSAASIRVFDVAYAASRIFGFRQIPVAVAIAVATACTPHTARHDGVFTPCPSTPNCVSSLAPAEDRVHFVEPLSFSGASRPAFACLQAVLAHMPGASRVSAGDDRAHWVFTTRWLRFRDDVHIRLVAQEGVIHIRSASRIGYGDMGVNRARVEAVRRAFAQTCRDRD